MKIENSYRVINTETQEFEVELKCQVDFDQPDCTYLDKEIIDLSKLKSI